MQRWDIFRDQRDRQIDRYVEAKKMILRVKRLAVVPILDKLIRQHWRTFVAHREVTLDKWQKSFIVLRVTLLWGRI